MELLLTVFLATPLENALRTPVQDIITGVQIVVPVLAVLYALYKMAEGGEGHNIKIMLIEVAGAIFVMEGLAVALKAWAATIA